MARHHDLSPCERELLNEATLLVAQAGREGREERPGDCKTIYGTAQREARRVVRAVLHDGSFGKAMSTLRNSIRLIEMARTCSTGRR